MPLPLAMMIPFMGIQSAVMAKQFGENFQYGKRRISAMSNEEFNKLTPAMLQERTNNELKAMIPNMKQSIIDMQGFQEFLVKEFVKMIGDILVAGLGKIIGVSDNDVDQALQDIEHFLHGHFDLHKGTVTQEDDPTKFNPPSPEPEPEPAPTGAKVGTPDYYYNDANLIKVKLQYVQWYSSGSKVLQIDESHFLSEWKKILLYRRTENEKEASLNFHSDYIHKVSVFIHSVTGGIWI